MWFSDRFGKEDFMPMTADTESNSRKDVYDCLYDEQQIDREGDTASVTEIDREGDTAAVSDSSPSTVTPDVSPSHHVSDATPLFNSESEGLYFMEVF